MMRLIRLKGRGGVGALRRALEAARDLTNAGFVVRVRVQVDAVPGPRARPGGLPVGFARGLEGLVLVNPGTPWHLPGTCLACTRVFASGGVWEGLEEEASEELTP